MTEGFPPGVSRDVPCLLASASILCHPARFEGFGLAPGEALACGVPVVADDDCPGITASLKHEQNALLVSRAEGVAGLAAALRRLIRDEAVRTRLAAAPASVSSYTQEECVARWLALIDRVIARQPLKEPLAA